MKNKNILLIIAIILTINTGNVFGQWVQASNGLSATSWCYSFTVNGSGIYTGTLNTGVYRTTDYGNNWIQTALTDKTVLSVTSNTNNIFAGTQAAGVYVSTNNGTNWTQTSLSTNNVFALAVSGNIVFAGTSTTGVYLSTNNGTFWTQTPLNDKTVFSISINGSNIFAGTSGSGVYVSTNNGSSWTQTLLNDKTVYALANSGINIFAGTNAGVYLSTNNGSSWTQTSLNTAIIRSLSSSGNNVFAGTSGGGGIYLTSDNGTNWTQKNQGLSSINIIGALFIENNFIFAGNWGASIWKRSLTEIIGIKNISSEVPAAFSLQQNYPNPFNPSTNIKFSIAKFSNVKIVLYDAIGREIKTLVNESLKPGTYESTFNSSSLNSGVYFYKISAGDFSETKKMLLIK